MYETDDIEVMFSTKKMPFEYKWIEFRLIVNQELYDEQVIDFKTFKAMEQSIISRLTKIKNEYMNDLTDQDNQKDSIKR